MSKKFLVGISVFSGIALSFFLGLYVGSTPTRQYVALTGGASGIAAMDLKNSTDQLVDPQGSLREDSAISNSLKQTLRIRLLLAAQLYCNMPEQYQRLARQSAIKSKAEMTGIDDRTKRSISFLISGSGGDGDGCFAS